MFSLKVKLGGKKQKENEQKNETDTWKGKITDQE